MGIFKKVFKGIGKAFKKVGKTIKKGFQKFGRFMNKLGILGQIGMMWVTGGLANMAMDGLMRLGSGFMQGLSEIGYQATAAGVKGAGAAKTGFAAGTARFAHAVVQGAANASQYVVDKGASITDSLIKIVPDTVRGIGNVLNEDISAIPVIDEKTGEAIAGKVGGWDDVAKNISRRFQAHSTRAAGHLADLREVAKILPGGDPYRGTSTSGPLSLLGTTEIPTRPYEGTHPLRSPEEGTHPPSSLFSEELAGTIPKPETESLVSSASGSFSKASFEEAIETGLYTQVGSLFEPPLPEDKSFDIEEDQKTKMELEAMTQAVTGTSLPQGTNFGYENLMNDIYRKDRFYDGQDYLKDLYQTTMSKAQRSYLTA